MVVPGFNNFFIAGSCVRDINLNKETRVIEREINRRFDSMNLRQCIDVFKVFFLTDKEFRVQVTVVEVPFITELVPCGPISSYIFFKTFHSFTFSIFAMVL
ncbi:hypothetical protein CJ20_279 [Escherichia phage CJ20]|nr:hypothetical protein CJ20_279 [Escherichia phage CJ20]